MNRFPSPPRGYFEEQEKLSAKLDAHHPYSAKSNQIGGDHYKKFAIQPVEFIHANGIPFCEGNVIKYVCRWKQKNGIADLEKARHYIDLLIELEGKEKS